MNNSSSGVPAQKPPSPVPSFLLGTALSASSVLMLSLSLPGYDCWYLLFVALVPLFLVFERVSARAAALLFELAGFAFFLVALFWLHHLTVVGWIALAFYLSLSFPLFAVITRFLCSGRARVPFVLAAPLVWVSLELLRGIPLGGFCWHYLGHGLYRQTGWIQIADFSGVYGVSFLLATVNAVLAHLIHLASTRQPRWGLRTAPAVIYMALLLVGTASYGGYRTGQTVPIPGPRVSVVQGNLPIELSEVAQAVGWTLRQDLEKSDENFAVYRDLTASLFSVRDDLVVWPETMVPPLEGNIIRLPVSSDLLPPMPDFETRVVEKSGVYRFINLSARAEKQVRDLRRRLARPFLVGSARLAFEDNELLNYNGVYYFPLDDVPFQAYFKIYPVPFGEYIPLRRFPPVRALVEWCTPEGYKANVTAGTDIVLFRVNGIPFATPICYEDTKPSLICAFVREGARFIVNLTNDGWFRDTPELDQHLANSVFRTVENRVALVRAANTGISAFITPLGVITSVVADPRSGRQRAVQGVLTDTVWLDSRHTFYTRRGDLFVWALVALTALLALAGAGLSRTGTRKSQNHGRQRVVK